ncbi:sigma 54 modulation/S30EA ribosomal C-terminal domain-containing protein [Actinomadura sp. ATCC 31491]|uniref:Sigma 54 modulation/S30EA ribosomal C-terminal domain-containing protein n=1 Tax=Actinomadura luzonensis TaxID=2805427 RepID=A0ABT0FY22_9ACTN|nr:sigma 54 modulation/S30EA ribosomal C-terminal domain-containing protein [Actinomadura luzonensis]MCK2217053.1 sigma 54 modulation/S30EA ribosomal C-terminal domain-containing protein [Actinomadura luzonensis]
MRHMPTALDPADVQVKIRGGIRPADVRRARVTMAELAGLAHEPVIAAKVTLATAPGLAARRRTAEAVLDVQGRLVRAQASAASTRAAIHVLRDRLRSRLLESARDWENRRRRHHRRPGPRHAGEQPRIVRRLAADRTVPDEAVVDMEQRGLDFLLFTEDVTGRDSIVYRAGGGYRLAQLVPGPGLPTPICAAISVSASPACRLTVSEAVERLELTGLPFVFFADAATGAGCVVHRRADGDHGLVSTVPGA